MRAKQAMLVPLGLIVGLILLSGMMVSCITTTTSVIPYTPAEFVDDNDSVIYVFRDKSTERGKKPVKVKVGDDEVGELWNLGYFEIHVPAGRHTIKCYMGGNIKAMNIECEANAYQYIQVVGKDASVYPMAKMAEKKLAKKMMLEGIYPAEVAEARGGTVNMEETNVSAEGDETPVE